MLQPLRHKCFNFLNYKASNYDIQRDSEDCVQVISERGKQQWSVSTDQQPHSSMGPSGLISAGKAVATAGTMVGMLLFSARAGGNVLRPEMSVVSSLSLVRPHVE